MSDAASVTDEPEVQSEEEKLKYLNFVEEAIQEVVVYASKAYDYVKDKAAPLEPVVEKMETTIKTVVGPAYDKFHDVPVHEVLKFVDQKVDESLTQLEKVLPPVVTSTAKSLSTTVVSDVKTVGVMETAKELLVKAEPVMEEYASSAWKSLNEIPLVSKVVKVIAPTASFISEKYNETVQKTSEEGYTISSYLPLVPTEKIAKVFSLPEPEAEPSGEEEAAEVPGEVEEVVEET